MSPVTLPPLHCAPGLCWPPPNVSCKSSWRFGSTPPQLLGPARRIRRYGPCHCWRRAWLSLCAVLTLVCAWGKVRSVARHNARRWQAKEAVNTSAVVLITVAAGQANGPSTSRCPADRRVAVQPGAELRAWAQGRGAVPLPRTARRQNFSLAVSHQ
jgi:hypothetical protein